MVAVVQAGAWKLHLSLVGTRVAGWPATASPSLLLAGRPRSRQPGEAPPLAYLPGSSPAGPHGRQRVPLCNTRLHMDGVTVDDHGPHPALQRGLADRGLAQPDRRLAEDLGCAPPRPGRPRPGGDRVCAGRPFFITIGVSRASEAPAASSAAITVGPQPRVEVVDVPTPGPGGPRCPCAGGRLGPTSSRSTFAWVEGSRPPAPTPMLPPRSIAGWAPYDRGVAVVRRAAQLGACASARPPRRTTAPPAAARRRRAVAPASRRARPGPGPEPTATAETTPTSSSPRWDKPSADPDDVGDRVEGADLVEVHVRGRGARGPAASADREPLRRHPAPARARRSRQTRRREQRLDVAPAPVGACCSATSTWHPGGRAKPLCGTRSPGSSATVLGGDRGDGGGQHVQRHPGADQGPRAACPRWRRRSASTQPRSRAGPRGRRCGRPRAANTPAPNPLSMLTTVTPGARGVQHPEQGGQPAERGAVAEPLVGTADQRHAGRARRPR